MTNNCESMRNVCMRWNLWSREDGEKKKKTSPLLGFVCVLSLRNQWSHGINLPSPVSLPSPPTWLSHLPPSLPPHLRLNQVRQISALHYINFEHILWRWRMWSECEWLEGEGKCIKYVRICYFMYECIYKKYEICYSKYSIICYTAMTGSKKDVEWN